MAAGHDDRARSEREQRAAQGLGLAVVAPPRRQAPSRPASTRASGRFGVSTLARGRISRTSGSWASGVEQPRARLGDHHRVHDHRRARGQLIERPRDGQRDLAGAEHPDLDRVHADVLDHRTHLGEHHLAGSGWIALTPTVFWAVIAVIAVMPCTPQRANAFRSACMPAPPPESEPAMLSAVRVRADPRSVALGEAEAGGSG